MRAHTHVRTRSLSVSFHLRFQWRPVLVPPQPRGSRSCSPPLLRLRRLPLRRARLSRPLPFPGAPTTRGREEAECNRLKRNHISNKLLWKAITVAPFPPKLIAMVRWTSGRYYIQVSASNSSCTPRESRSTARRVFFTNII